ncbi:MAG: hypothetical protein ABI591_27430 [Kofleriaceae bacterium]
MLRLALVLLIACDAGARDEVAIVVAPPPLVKVQPVPRAPAPPPAKPSPAKPTTTIPPAKIATLTGCWRHDASESWTFRRDGNAGLVVVRELGNETYADRARIPRPVLYDPTSETFGFGAAGRLHGLMMLFQIEHSTLKTSVFYTTHTPGAYAWTGNTSTLKRC